MEELKPCSTPWDFADEAVGGLRSSKLIVVVHIDPEETGTLPPPTTRTLGQLSTKSCHHDHIFFLFSLYSAFVEGPGRLRTFPASWYTPTRSIN